MEYNFSRFQFEESLGYWSLSGVIVLQGSTEVKITPKDIGAPMKFSYHCTDVHLFGENDEELVINKLQVMLVIMGSAWEIMPLFGYRV